MTEYFRIFLAKKVFRASLFFQLISKCFKKSLGSIVVQLKVKFCPSTRLSLVLMFNDMSKYVYVEKLVCKQLAYISWILYTTSSKNWSRVSVGVAAAFTQITEMTSITAAESLMLGVDDSQLKF